MNSYQYEFRVHVSDYDLNFDILCRHQHDGKNCLAQPVEFKVLEPDTVFPPPMLHLDNDAASSLMDALWIAGIRPSQRIIEPQNIDHMNNEIQWLRDTADHLMKKPK